MDRRRALLLLVAFLVLVDLAGVLALRDAWLARQARPAHPQAAATHARPAGTAPAGAGPAVVHTGG